MDNRYFQHDLLVFKNFDIFRCVLSEVAQLPALTNPRTNRNRDFAFALLAVYAILGVALPATSTTVQLTLAFVNALAWRLFHSFGLGFALKAQSERKWIVRHFIKHYHYEAEGEVSRINPMIESRK